MKYSVAHTLAGPLFYSLYIHTQDNPVQFNSTQLVFDLGTADAVYFNIDVRIVDKEATYVQLPHCPPPGIIELCE